MTQPGPALQAMLLEDIATIRGWSARGSSVQSAEIDTINVIIGTGAAVLTAGIAACLVADFNAVITGCVLQEFDGTSGSVSIKVESSPPGATPTWTTITPTTPPAIVSGRSFIDSSCSTWAAQNIARGSLLRFSVVSAATIQRVLLALRIRRLEP